jgi:pimeloyl-ACP methyl ester carboxylesterase
MTRPSGFKSPEGQAAFLAVYDAFMDLWPVPYETFELRSRFGKTHGIVCGPEDAPALVLLHGFCATLAMWQPNIGDFARDYRVYAINVMGQPGLSVPDEPIQNMPDYMEWLSTTLDELNLKRVFLIGQSYGGWLSLNYAGFAPDRVHKVALLSPAGLAPLVPQFTLRGMLMGLIPSRLTVYTFANWMGFREVPGIPESRSFRDLFYVGMKHFRMPAETARIPVKPLTDDELRRMGIPVLLLIGENEVVFDPVKALERARRLIPDFRGELVPDSNHEMCRSRARIVDEKVLEFLRH